MTERAELLQINDWWWAIRPDGGSIRLKHGSYFYYPERDRLSSRLGSRSRNGRTKAPRGPFRDLPEVIAAAQRDFDFQLQLVQNASN